MPEKFDWNDVQDDVVLTEQLAVAVYLNPKGDTVIRQAADAYRSEDSTVIINRKNLSSFVAALQRHLEEQQEKEASAN
jgi:hypothetical protein